jgi:hypothetical protein
MFLKPGNLVVFKFFMKPKRPYKSVAEIRNYYTATSRLDDDFPPGKSPIRRFRQSRNYFRKATRGPAHVYILKSAQLFFSSASGTKQQLLPTGGECVY